MLPCQNEHINHRPEPMWVPLTWTIVISVQRQRFDLRSIVTWAVDGTFGGATCYPIICFTEYNASSVVALQTLMLLSIDFRAFGGHLLVTVNGLRKCPPRRYVCISMHCVYWRPYFTHFCDWYEIWLDARVSVCAGPSSVVKCDT